MANITDTRSAAGASVKPAATKVRLGGADIAAVLTEQLQ